MNARDLQIALYQHNAAIQRARDEYEAHPTVAVEQDWCPVCCWPRPKRRCDRCRDAMRSRALREAKRS